MKPVKSLEIGDVFYIMDCPGLISGPYTVTKDLRGMLGYRTPSGHIVTLAPDTQALSELDAIREVLRRDGRCRDIDAAAGAWPAYGFDYHGACRWIRNGCWDAAIAAAFRDAGLGALDFWHVMNPIDAVNDGYVTVDELISRARNQINRLSF
jgi:hypothetical protein